ncbi:conjugal transfer protein TrbE [Acidithiobacillus sp.]|uniref:VirB4 family type IV secretion/conjugal transfer ATPase n=1 Tax=Acidithiobacillus sp. TaxID=1872118 RepID=UPI003D067954
MRSLKEFRNKAYGLPDLLPWAGLVGNGIVLTKGGAFMAGWYYSGPDLDSATNAELGNMAARINAALSLGDGWVLNCDAVRIPAPGYAPPGAFPDRTTRLIDDLRRERYESEQTNYTSRYALTLTWFPMPDAAGKAAALFVEGGKTASAGRNLLAFQERLREIEGRLSGMLKIRRMLDAVDDRGEILSEILQYLEYCVSFRNRPFRLAMVPMYLDAVLGHHDLTTGFQPRVDELHVACLAIEGFPSTSFPGILDFLSRLPVSYRWSNRFIYLDPPQAEKVINRYRSRWSQKRKSAMNVVREQAGGQATHINIDADNMTNDAIAAIGEATSGVVRYGYYTSVILLAHEDEGVLHAVGQEVRKVIENRGFGVRIEDVNAVEAYLGSMPGNTAANVRRPLVNTMNLAHLLPFTSIWPGPDEHPCPFYPPHSPPLLFANTDGSTPFRICLHAGDLGHAAIVGPTGAGKSTLLSLLVAQQFRYPRAQVFAFDKGYSMLPLVLAAGGQHYDIAGEDADLAFCPLGQVDRPAEQRWAAEWIESLAELQGVVVNPRMREEIYRAMQQLGSSTTSASQRTMTDFLTILQDQGLRDALRYYTVLGPIGHLLDAKEDGLGEDVFQVFEMEHLLNRGDKALLPVLTYLFHRIEQRFQGQPTLLVLDEAWVMLGHPAFRAKIREWLKVLRKANVAVVFATQSLSDLARSGIADVIFESCPTKILLPNAEAMTDQSRPFYESIGLNSRQIEILAMATPKRQYYMMHPDGRRLFELGLSPGELAFVGSSGKEDLARIRGLRETCGDAWPAQWLRERQLYDLASQWEGY